VNRAKTDPLRTKRVLCFNTKPFPTTFSRGSGGRK
jgi:hypothetical protein